MVDLSVCSTGLGSGLGQGLDILLLVSRGTLLCPTPL